MMSFGEWVSVLTLVGVTGAVIVACFIYLISQIKKETAAKAVYKERAKVNEVAVEKLKKADEIIASDRDLVDITDRLRSGNF